MERNVNDFCRVFGERLKSERNRLGMNQAQFAEVGGVAKLTQLKYEKGERMPSVEYLHGIQQQGVEVGYLLTGKKVDGLVPGGQVSGTVVDVEVLRSIIEMIELGLQAAGILWPAKYKAEIIATFYSERNAFDWEGDVDASKLKSAEAIVKVLTQLGQLKNTSL
jgi:transcriptional regulator with XRE-family HTH domain